MRRKIGVLGRRSFALMMSAAMGMSGLTMPVTAGAETSSVDETVMYAVDCGDVDPGTASDDDLFFFFKKTSKNLLTKSDIFGKI